MQNLYGNNKSGETPDIVTYYHPTADSATVGFWDKKGKLYSVSKFKGSSIDFKLDYTDAKHIMLVGNPSGQLIEQDDFEENEKENYFAYIQSTDGAILKSELPHSQQVVLFTQVQTPNLKDGSKCPKHILQAIGLSQAKTKETVTVIKCDHCYHIAHVVGGKINHSMCLNVELAPAVIHYKLLSFYQEYSIHPGTTLKTFSVTKEILKALDQHLPSVESLKVPETHIASPVDNHSDIYPHYLAFVCVL